MQTILTILGARPQFIKAAMVSRALLAGTARCTETLIHTGQHYDPEMSQVFFDEMGIPEPAVNLAVGSGLHGEMTGRMLAALEAEMLARQPDRVLVYGDTNSTLAGALAASKLHIPVCHVEAGLRSFNRRMPEEINRVLTDHMADLLLCPTREAMANLRREGIEAGVHAIGDVMHDAALVFGALADERSDILERHGLTAGAYALATVHRAENTDEQERLAGILEGLGTLAQEGPVVLPLHPRTRKCIEAHGLGDRTAGLTLLPPVPFLDMVRLERSARLILTDSGGVQKEAYFHQVPCITLREETEWVETVSAGWNQLAGADPKRISAAIAAASPGEPIPDYGDGHAADEVARFLLA